MRNVSRTEIDSIAFDGYVYDYLTHGQITEHGIWSEGEKAPGALESGRPLDEERVPDHQDQTGQHSGRFGPPGADSGLVLGQGK